MVNAVESESQDIIHTAWIVPQNRFLTLSIFLIQMN